MASELSAAINVCKYTIFVSPLISIGEENVIEEKKMQKNKEKILEEKKIQYLNPQKTSPLPKFDWPPVSKGIEPEKLTPMIAWVVPTIPN